METVDSKQRELSAQEIITMSAHQQDLGGVPPAAAILAVAKESTMPSCDSVKFGNTVFIGHRGSGEKSHIMEGRAFNVDTADNFVKNGIEYAKYLQKTGITRYSTQFSYPAYVSLFRRIIRYIRRTSIDTAMHIYRTNVEGEYIVRMAIGKDRIE